MGNRFSVDPDKAIPGKPLPWHRQMLEDVMLRGLPKDSKHGRVHIREFPARLLKQFHSLGKTEELRYLGTRQQIVTWFGLEILTHRDEMHLLRAARLRYAESDAGKYADGPVEYRYTPADNNFHLTREAAITLSTDPQSELETLASELALSMSTLVIWSTLAAFSHSKSWLDKATVQLCQAEFDKAMTGIALYAAMTNAVLDGRVVAESTPQPVQDEEE